MNNLQDSVPVETNLRHSLHAFLFEDDIGLHDLSSTKAALAAAKARGEAWPAAGKPGPHGTHGTEGKRAGSAIMRHAASPSATRIFFPLSLLLEAGTWSAVQVYLILKNSTGQRATALRVAQDSQKTVAAYLAYLTHCWQLLFLFRGPKSPGPAPNS